MRRLSTQLIFGGLLLGLAGCGNAPPAPSAQDVAGVSSIPVTGLSDAAFATLVERVSEEGGFFDTDNLISNETGFLTVMDVLADPARRGGGYIGVGPDQNYSYLAQLEPELVFLTDIRRDNLLHHLLLKALIERAPTRIEFLAGLHGVEAPTSPSDWVERPLAEIVDWIDGQTSQGNEVLALRGDIQRAVLSWGLDISEDDLATIARFHDTFVRAGLSLRFTTFGRPPRPYYPTNRQLMLEMDFDGDRASYVSSPEAYQSLRRLHLENRIIPVVGDLSGPTALREIGAVFSEVGIQLNAIYTSNVEFYLWRGGTFPAWVENLRTVPASEDAVVIRSVFPNGGGVHPSAVRRYYSTQTLQSVETLLDSDFTSYRDVVTRDVLGLAPVGAGR